MKKFFLLIILVCIGIFIGSPFYSVYQLKKAYDNQDGQVVANAIDYNQLTENLKNQLNTNFEDTLTQHPLIAKLGGDTILVQGHNFIEQSVDGAINSENISAIIDSEGQLTNRSTKELAAIWLAVGDEGAIQNVIHSTILLGGNIKKSFHQQINTLVNKQTEQLAEQVQTGNDSEIPSFSYCGINCFTISGEVKGYPLTVIMAREGLINWKVIDVDLP